MKFNEGWNGSPQEGLDGNDISSEGWGYINSDEGWEI